MTGREQKVYYSYSQISQKHNIPEDGPQQQLPILGKDARTPTFSLPELEHNLQLLIDLTEQEIIQNDRQLQYERDMVVNLSHEIEKMEKVLLQEETDIRNLSEVLELVEECERRMQPNCEDPLTLPECVKIFETLQDKYYEEYQMSDRVDLAVAIVFPLVKDYFKNWDPLKVGLPWAFGCSSKPASEGLWIGAHLTKLAIRAMSLFPLCRTAQPARRSWPNGKPCWRTISCSLTVHRISAQMPSTGELPARKERRALPQKNL